MLAHETSGEARVSFASDRTSRVVVCHVRLVLSSLFRSHLKEKEVFDAWYAGTWWVVGTYRHCVLAWRHGKRRALNG